jgi:tetratricopeptide (TPR) repeat protein
LVYGKAANFGLTRYDDDIWLIKSYGFIKNLNNAAQAFDHNVFISSGVLSNFYRPVLLITFILNAQFCRQNIGCYHLTDLVLHSGFGIILFYFLISLKIDKKVAFFLTLFFITHPVLTSAVVWIPGRNDILLALFFIPAFMLAKKWLETAELRYLLGHYWFYFLSLFTKETAIMFIPVLAAYYLAQKKFGDLINKSKLLGFGWVLITGIWFWLRNQTQKSYSGPVFGMLPVKNFIGIFTYLGKLIPVSLSVFPENKIVQVSNFIGTGIALICGWLVWKSRHKSYFGLLIFGGIWFFGLLLPSIIQINQQAVTIMLEHRFYLPTVGLLIGAGAIIHRSGYKQYILMITAGVILVFSLISMKRSNLYSNEIKFWTQAVKNSPASPVALNNLGYMYQYVYKDSDQAMELYQKALKLAPNALFVRTNMGVIYMNRGEFDLAEKEFLTELKSRNGEEIWLQLGRLYYGEKKFDQALNAWEKAYALNPYFIPVNINLALVNSDLERFDQAKKYYYQAIDLGAMNTVDKDYISGLKFLESK